MRDGLGGGVPTKVNIRKRNTGKNVVGRNALVSDDRANEPDSGSAHDALRHLLDPARHRRGEHGFAKIWTCTGGEDVVRLLDKVELEELVRFVEDEVAKAKVEQQEA